jgi:hypothetical protein
MCTFPIIIFITIVNLLNFCIGLLSNDFDIAQSTKLEDVKSKMEQGHHSFTEFTQAIDTMRTSRDAKICDIEKLQAEVEVNNQ